MRKRKHSRHPHKGKQPRSAPSHGLPEMCVLTIIGTDEHGELLAQPLKWDERRKPPQIVVTQSGRGRSPDAGDRVLAKLHKVRPHLYQALVIKVLPSQQPQPVLGVFAVTAEGGLIEPVSRKLKESFMVARTDTLGAKHGELVAGVTLPGIPSMSMTYAKITERLGSLDSPRAASLIAANIHALPSIFSAEATEESEAATPPVMEESRLDVRHLPLVTIDGEDARDFDDAVFAEPDGDGFHIIVAIADVAYYVKPGSALDAEAFERGNSVYFPDRVIPMLPERLSNGLCSLVPNEDRYCLLVQLWIDANGNTKRYQFARGLMRSAARLTYEQVEKYRHEASGIVPQASSLLPPLAACLKPLWAAYEALAKERERRGALDLDLPEYKILFDAMGSVEAIVPRERLEAHRLIESFMIAANVAAADFLLKHKAPGIYRVHETPAEEKLEDLRDFLKLSGFSLHIGAGIKPAHFNRVLRASADAPNVTAIHTMVLRSQMQAYYAAENLGHFGLGLQKYCHFTSPIRRYADLVVHRSLAALLAHHSLHKKESKRLAEVALHISETERRAMMAERDAADRYKISFISKHIGDTFTGAVVSLNEYGLFVALRDNGINGFIPVRSLAGDFFIFDKRRSCFRGQRTKQTFTIGQPMIIRVVSANPITGSLIFEPAQAVSAPDRSHRHHASQKHKQRRKKRR